MSKPFDVTTKYLVEAMPADWLRFLGLADAPVDVIDADLATVSAEADKVLRIQSPDPHLVHLEFQASYDPSLSERTLQYSVLLRRRHGLPVLSCLLLLRPEADGPNMTGNLEHFLPDGTKYLEFSYRVARIWEQSTDGLLSGGLATLPLTPLADVAREKLPGVLRRMEERIRQESAPDVAGMLWTATYVLMGLRYPPPLTEQLLQGVRNMKESATYQAIINEGVTLGLQEGRTEEARTIVLRQGIKRFGQPDEKTRKSVTELDSLAELERLSDRLLDVESWEDLLAPS